VRAVALAVAAVVVVVVVVASHPRLLRRTKARRSHIQFANACAGGSEEPTGAVALVEGNTNESK
jgi:hypothetical protein